MPDLLLELFSEEIPARMQQETAEYLKNKMGLEKSSVFVTPRRLTFTAKELPINQPDTSIEKRGPKINAPEKAVEGFAKSVGLSPDELEQRGDYYFAVQHTKGVLTKDLLKEKIEEVLNNFHWQKSMHWGDNDIKWVRPLHNILCIFNGEVIPVEFGHLAADNRTYGHRFLSPDAVEITNLAEYEILLKEKFVILSSEERKRIIKEQADKLAGDKGLTVEYSEKLLDEVAGLAEYPVVLLGRFDDNFLQLPHEAIRSEMNHHQKYFSCLDEYGNLAPYFIITSNMKTEDGGKAITAGNEKVLRARLSDAEFFWNEDLKKGLEAGIPKLKKMVFHNKLGSVADKSNRIADLALEISDRWIEADKELVEEAALLCKADLVTEMVGEFPDLQGIMGRYYAIEEEYEEEVYDALKEHYMPKGASDDVPKKPVSIIIALADRVDTLTGLFSVGEKPTGSKDPFGLRRAALGIIRIILENGLRIPIEELLNISSPTPNLPPKCGENRSSPSRELLDFFEERLKVILKDYGIRHDIVSASIESKGFDIIRIKKRAEALQKFLAENEALLAAYTRGSNILKGVDINYKAEPSKELMNEEDEITLYQKIAELKPKVQESLAKEDFERAMSLLATLKPPVDAFFDNVIVNCDDEDIKQNRQRLLWMVVDTMNLIANFSKIEK